MIEHDATNAAAFGAGSDARIAGLPISACMMTGKDRDQWRAGWHDADANWGRWATRWPVRRLPPVSRANEAFYGATT